MFYEQQRYLAMQRRSGKTVPENLQLELTSARSVKIKASRQGTSKGWLNNLCEVERPKVIPTNGLKCSEKALPYQNMY